MLLLLLVAFVAGACDQQPAAPADAHRLVVVATVYPLADAARQIGGSMADVSWVVESGQSLANVESSDALRNRLRTANLVFAGGQTEPWAILGFNDPQHEGRLLRLDQLPSVHDPSPEGLLWLDPVVMMDGCRELDNRLRAFRPQYERALAERTDRYIAPIDQLYKQYELKFANASNKQLLAINEEFSPLLHRFGLQLVVAAHGSPMNVTDDQIRALQNMAILYKTQLLVIRADTPGPNVKDLAERSRLQIVLLDVLGSSAAGGRNTYVDLLRYDLEQLEKATMIQ